MTAKKSNLVDKQIVFPPMDAQEEAKFRRFLTTTGEFMGVELESELMTVITVKVPGDRPDVVTVMNKLAAANKKRQA